MKRTFLGLLLIFGSVAVFGLDNETPSVLIEANSGYAIGVNLPNAVPVELKLVYPFSRFGFTVELGPLFLHEKAVGYHTFFGPTLFMINNSKIRVSLSLGPDMMGNKTKSYYGIGGLVSFNYSLTKNVYIGVNFEANYDFLTQEEEITGYEDAAIGVDENGNKVYPIDNHGNPVKLTPVTKNKNVIGNNIYIKPTIGIGWQF